MKLKVSVALNLILIMVLISLCAKDVLGGYYYHKFTGFALRAAAAQIDAGNSAWVSESLKTVPQPPEYSDLGTILEKLESGQPKENSSGPPGSP